MSPNRHRPVLPLIQLSCHFESETPARMPAYAGSAWRGAFGHSLKRAVCVVRDTECRSCLLYRTCAYPYLFETPLPADTAKMRRYPVAPHPFVLRIEPAQRGHSHRLGLTLFGRAERYAPYAVYALERAGESGLGRDRRPLHLKEVLQADEAGAACWRSVYRPGQPLEIRPAAAPDLPAVPDVVEIRMESPLRLRREEHLVTPSTFRFSDFFRSLLRRISMLTYFHTETPLETDFSGLVGAAGEITLRDPQLRWYDWTRYSSRQDTTMEMGGLLGSFTLDGSGLAEFWPYLWLGQWTHAGKATTMGLGRYRLISASLPQNNTLD